jgi:flagellar assembly protein FliH
MSSNRVIQFATPPRRIHRSGAEVPADVALAEAQFQAAKEAEEEAHRRGFEEAMTYLDQKMLEQRSDLAQLQENTFRALARTHESLVAQVAQILPSLAIEVARRALAGFEPSQELIAGLCADTLAEIAPGTSGVEVWLAPRDYELVRGVEAEFSHKYPSIQVHPDPDLVPGDCRARSQFGAVDARLSTKLSNLARSLA